MRKNITIPENYVDGPVRKGLTLHFNADTWVDERWVNNILKKKTISFVYKFFPFVTASWKTLRLFVAELLVEKVSPHVIRGIREIFFFEIYYSIKCGVKCKSFLVRKWVVHVHKNKKSSSYYGFSQVLKQRLNRISFD